MGTATGEASTFRRFDPAQLPELMSWFPDAATLRIWGGPDFRFPFTPGTFRIDSKIDELDTWSLVAGDGALAAFGQCYLRVGRCHFGRVGVSPRLRGGGLGTRLLCEMAREGLAKFGQRELSLFVRRDNEAAHRLYQRLGFREAPYPERGFMTDSRYMIAASLPAGAASSSSLAGAG
jgi:ribosomal protein S18 acetylase RimI-like enzyme